MSSKISSLRENQLSDGINYYPEPRLKYKGISER